MNGDIEIKGVIVSADDAKKIEQFNLAMRAKAVVREPSPLSPYGFWWVYYGEDETIKKMQCLLSEIEHLKIALNRKKWLDRYDAKRARARKNWFRFWAKE